MGKDDAGSTVPVTPRGLGMSVGGLYPVRGLRAREGSDRICVLESSVWQLCGGWMEGKRRPTG